MAWLMAWHPDDVAPLMTWQVRSYIHTHALSRQSSSRHTNANANAANTAAAAAASSAASAAAASSAAAAASVSSEDARTGGELAAMIEQIVDALNTHELPTAGGVVDAFNARLVTTALASLQRAMRAIPLPIHQEQLLASHARLLADAQRTLVDSSFGASNPDELTTGAKDTLTALSDANFVASQRVCDTAWAACEAAVQHSQKAWLPSTSRYSATLAACNTTLLPCVGPAAERFHTTLLSRLLTTGTQEYEASYRDRLQRACVLASVLGLLLGRFWLRSPLVELLSAAAFFATQLLPTLLPFGAYERLLGDYAHGGPLVDMYERLVYNPFLDLDEVTRLDLT